MTRLNLYVVSAVGIVWVLACGNATTTLGGDKDGGSGAAASGGTTSDDAAAGASGGSSAASGTGGSAIMDVAHTCQLPTTSPDAGATLEEQQRADLIRAYCANLAQWGCLEDETVGGDITIQARYCSPDEKLIACELDQQHNYTLGIERWPALTECDDEWQAVARCGAAAPLSAAFCVNYFFIGANSGLDDPCLAEKEALSACQTATGGAAPIPEQTVTGARAQCSYWDATTSWRGCEIVCDLGVNRYFRSTCEKVAGSPLQCDCSVNGNPLVDSFVREGRFYAGDCAEAARFMADGECINILDCCFTYFDANHDSHCACTSDVTATGETSCEAAAARGGGQVVSICPRYEFENSCWPPETCP